MLSAAIPWLLATALGQAPADDRAKLLDAVPADAEVVVAIKGVRATVDDLTAMVKAMSPTLAEQVEPMIKQGPDQFAEQFGEEAAKTPFLLAGKLPAPDAEGEPSFVVLVPTGNVEGVVKSMGGDPGDEKDGVITFKAKDGKTLYATGGDDFTAFGADQAMVKAIAAKPEKSLGQALPERLRAALLDGDAGLYVDLKAVQERYGEQIDAARKQFMDALDQAGEQMQQKEQMEQAKQLYGAMFDAMKQADAIAVHVDFDAEALDAGGFLALKPDSKAAATLKDAQRGTGEALSTLPPGYLVYAYVNADAEATQGMMQLNLTNLPGGGEAAKKYAEAIRSMGRQQSVTAFTMGNGFDIVAVGTPENPEKYAAATTEMMKSMSGIPGIKDAKLEANVGTHKGFQLSRATITFDFDKMLGDAAANPMAGTMLKAMFGEAGSMTTFFGSDGKRFVSVTAKDLAGAQKKIDALLASGGGIGGQPGYKALRGRLPKEANALFLVSAQGIVKVFGQILGTVMGGDPIAPPAEMPKEAAYFGGSLAAYPEGYEFELVVPSAVGPVFEKGFGPIIQGLQGQVNQ